LPQDVYDLIKHCVRHGISYDDIFLCHEEKLEGMSQDSLRKLCKEYQNEKNEDHVSYSESAASDNDNDNEISGAQATSKNKKWNRRKKNTDHLHIIKKLYPLAPEKIIHHNIQELKLSHNELVHRFSDMEVNSMEPIGQLLGISYSIGFGFRYEKSEELKSRIYTQLHPALRNGRRNNKIPRTIGATWNWKVSDVPKIINFCWTNRKTMLEEYMHFYCFAGPEGIHLRRQIDQKKMIHTRSSKINMVIHNRDYNWEVISLNETNRFQSIMEKLISLHFGSWYFIAGTIQRDDDIKEFRSFLQLFRTGHSLPNGNLINQAIFLIGCRGRPDISVTALAKPEVAFQFKHNKVQSWKIDKNVFQSRGCE